jgi:hypothetical protein
MNGLSLSQFYRQTFLWCVDPKLPKNVKFSLSQGEVQKLSGEVQNDLGGGAQIEPHTYPQNPAMISFE